MWGRNDKESRAWVKLFLFSSFRCFDRSIRNFGCFVGGSHRSRLCKVSSLASRAWLVANNVCINSKFAHPDALINAFLMRMANFDDFRVVEKKLAKKKSLLTITILSLSTNVLGENVCFVQKLQIKKASTMWKLQTNFFPINGSGWAQFPLLFFFYLPNTFL